MIFPRSRLFFRTLSLAALGLCLLACSSQEDRQDAAKKKAPPSVSATPAAAPAGAPTTPKTAEDLINQGKELLTATKYDLAIAKFSEAIKLNPQSVSAYNSRGIASCNIGQLDQAIADFSRVIEIDPKFGKAYNNRAVAYSLKGDRDKARQDAEKAQSLGIQVNQAFMDSLKQGDVKAEEKSKGAVPPGPGPAPAKPAAAGPGQKK